MAWGLLLALCMDATTEPRTRRVPAWLAGAVVAVGLMVVLVVWVRREASEVAALDATTRHELFKRTLANLRTCGVQEGLAATEFCEQQARFARQFPECDAGCRELTEQWLAAHR